MANQIIIDIGAAANDGTGDPLRTAFNYVNENFSNVWNTGLPSSNIQFVDNRVLTVNTNSNLVLAPNGIGKVVSNVDILPSINRGQSLGSTVKKWNSVNTYYVNADSANIGSFGNLTVAVANLHITGGSNGYVLQTDGAGNLTWTAQTGGGGNGVPGGANTQVQYNNAGSFGGSAAFTFNRTSNVLTVNGNISVGNASVTNVVAAQNITATTGTFTGDQFSDGAMYIGSPAGTVLGSDVVIQITANSGSYSQTNFQNINSGVTASSDYILTADNGNNTTHFLDMGITSSGWDGSETNVLSGLTANNGYLYVQDGNLTLGTRAGNVSYSWKFDTTGNLTVAGNVIPAGNNTQSLGSATRQWNDLYLSNATIYMNSVPISLNSSNVMTVNGADVVTTAANGESSIGNLNILGTTIEIAAGAPETLINISPDVEGWAYLQLPNDATANVYNTRLHNDVGNIEIGANGNTWQFNNAGSLMLPGNAVANNASISSIENGVIVKLNSQANGYVGITGFGSAGNNVAAITAVGLDGETDRVIVSVYNPNIDDGEAWTFNNAGDFTTAGGNIFFSNGANSAVIVPSGSAVKIAADRGDTTTGYVNVTSNGITIDALGSSTSDITIRAGDDVVIRGGNKVSAPQQRGGDITIAPGNGGDDGGSGAGDGGYVEVVGGDGGLGVNGGAGTGGEVRLVGGYGGTGNIDNAIVAGDGGMVVVIGGTGGVNLDDPTLNGPGGNVEIYGGQGSIDNANNRPGGPAGHVFLRGGNWGFNFVESGNVHVETYNGNDFLNWKFDNQGRTYFPGLSTARGDTTGGTISGFTLRIGDGTNEAVITTPDGDANTVSDSQRIVINPGKGADLTSGEGGDIYLWAGRGGSGDGANAVSAGSGGDIKIRGGQGGGVNGDGGYIRMEAGDGATGSLGDSGAAGYIEITGGSSGVGRNGGYVRILAGQGDVNGGDANITAGVGVNGLGGNVNIVGGTSGLGAGNCGNVNIWAGVSLPAPWTFDEDGFLTLPGEGYIRAISETISIKSYDLANSLGYGLRVGDTGGLYLEQGTNPAYLTLDANVGNAQIYSATGTGGAGGKDLTIYAGDADQSDFYTTPGGNVNIRGGQGAFNDGGGGGPGGSVNISAGVSSDPAGHPGNVTINTFTNSWNFDYNGTLNLPEGTAYIGSAANALSLHANDTEAIYISQISNGISLETDGNVTILSNVTGNVNYAWTFDNTGNLTTPGSIVTGSGSGGNISGANFVTANVFSASGNITGNYFIGNGSLLTGISANYGNSNVATFLAAYGSNTISTTGTITSGNILSNGYARLSGTFDESQASTAGLYLGYAGGTPRMMFATGNTSQTLEIDNDGGTLRIYKPGTTLASLNTSGNFSVLGNISGANVISANTISASGNITANIVSATTNGSGTNFKVGDDMWLGDVNVSDTMSLRGQQNAANAYLLFGNADTTSTLGRSGSGPLTWTGNFSVTGNITGNTAGYAIGYRDIPQVSFTGNTTIATTDAGKHYYSTQSTGYTLTIANNASQGFQVGAAITIVNQGTGNIAIAQGSGVSLYMAGNSTAANRSVATFGMATIMKVATDTWFISGTGVS